MIEINKGRMDEKIYVENKAAEIGLINIYAYHCERCNYVWLPRDFDFNFYVKNGKTDDFWGHDLFYMEPPKSCARCKSRSWNNFPRRRLKLHPALRGQKWIADDKLNDVTSRLNEPWFNSAARLRALDRQGKLTPEDIIQYS